MARTLRAVGAVGVALLVAVLLGSAMAAAGEAPEAALAQEILKATGVKGGLIIHLGCGDGRLTAALRVGESYVVQGLDASAENVRQAREHIQKLGLYGPVSVERLGGSRLPYADNLANLLVAEALGDVAADEAMRVLAPGGALYVKQDGGWTKAVKPRPANVDEWTHYLHDASGNPVAHDAVVGPPRHVQWIAEPRHMRSHEHVPGIYALVSAGERIFYIADEAPPASILSAPRWHLEARDAHNGLLLWKRPFSPWFPHIINWGVTPPHLQRRLVAVAGRVYATLGLHAPVAAVDAATGETLEVYDQTAGTEEIVCHKGTLLLAIRSVTDERAAEFQRLAQLTAQGDRALRTREGAEPLIARFRAAENKAEMTVLALDAETGRELWRKAGADAAGLRPLTLCASGDRAFHQRGRDAVCLDLRTGRELWATAAPGLRLVSDGTLVCASGQTLTALSAETGKTLWTEATPLTQILDVFAINGSIWAGGFKPIEGKRGPAWGPYFATQHDLATGKLLKHLEPENPGHHHRCWKNKATGRYILGGRRGVEFIDLQSGEVLWHSWVRGVCKYGVMPSNGLLYAPPHACGCYITAKLAGFYALAPARTGEAGGARDEGAERLQRGPAYRPDGGRPTADGRGDDWPTYRHDAQRSGSARTAVPTDLRVRWQAEVGGTLASPTVAGGRVFVASVEEHAVVAVDATSGAPAWRFTAGARVDSPPTLHGGQAIFGCRDGHVYCVRASDGALAWRLRVADDARRIAACGQLESASPAHGSVLVQDGLAWVAAGRSSYLDGGIGLCRIRPETGELLSRTPIYSPDPQTGRQPPHLGPCQMPGALADILAGDGQCVYLRDLAFDPRGASQAKGNPHLLTLTGFLDGTWPHRSYWIFGTQCSLATGCSGRDRTLIYGRMLVFDDTAIYGYGRKGVHWSNRLEDGPYRLFAIGRADGKEQWAKPAAVQVRAMVLAGNVLFVAGPAVRDQDGPALLLAISVSDGAELARQPLAAPPVFDGMAAAGGRLYIALENGALLCM